MEENLNILKMEDDNIVPTQLDEIWKTTSIFFQMEDNLNFALGSLGSWFLVCNIVSTQLDEIWKTTSILLKLEDNLNFYK